MFEVVREGNKFATEANSLPELIMKAVREYLELRKILDVAR